MNQQDRKEETVTEHKHLLDDLRETIDHSKVLIEQSNTLMERIDNTWHNAKGSQR